MTDKTNQVSQRQIILELLLEIWEKGAFCNEVLDGALKKYGYLPDAQKYFIRRICEGSVRWLIRLDYYLDVVSKTKTAKMKPVIRAILRMGAYQILFAEDIPSSAAVNEAVKLTKKRGLQSLSGFVNGVLRSLDRKKDEISLPDPKQDRIRYLAVAYSFPEWLVDQILDALPSEQAEHPEKVFSALSEKRPLCVRLSRRMTEEEKRDLLAKMQQQGITVRASEKLAYAYFLEGVSGIENLPGYAQGYLYFQDIGSMMVVENAGLKKGDLVVDVCAAPGGKSLHAADVLAAMDEQDDAAGKGFVICGDLTEEKADRIRENAARSGFDNLEIRVWDARQCQEDLIEKADVVIADLPCSGLGVMGRKPDIKYHISPEKIASLQQLQRQILSQAVRYVKPGGKLVYSTCTMTREENEDNRDWLLAETEFTKRSELRMTPGLDESDGFYIAVFQKPEG
ncbi:MAG: 16S rRNA (cytosine(967)-C(5))-methyltransferase RsmB [Lachnospiraceae bacterium]|nr:16S rRNA (cytosine(967)-C(5))-methyltransferase RsmB [Lachnospiraceae bacterium]